MEKKYLNDSGLMRFWGKIKSYTKSVSDDLQGQINDKQQQITANKSAQDAKNASLDDNIKKLNTRDDQITETLNNISATGGASVASAVTYDNTTSQLTSANIQGAVDELQGAKIDKTSILQESGDAEDKVMSQKATYDADKNLNYGIVSLRDTIGKEELVQYTDYDYAGLIYANAGIVAANDIYDAIQMKVSKGDTYNSIDNYVSFLFSTVPFVIGGSTGQSYSLPFTAPSDGYILITVRKPNMPISVSKNITGIYKELKETKNNLETLKYECSNIKQDITILNNRLEQIINIGNSGEKVRISVNLVRGTDSGTWRVYGTNQEGTTVNSENLIVSDTNFGDTKEFIVPSNGFIYIFTTAVLSSERTYNVIYSLSSSLENRINDLEEVYNENNIEINGSKYYKSVASDRLSAALYIGHQNEEVYINFNVKSGTDTGNYRVYGTNNHGESLNTSDILVSDTPIGVESKKFTVPSDGYIWLFTIDSSLREPREYEVIISLSTTIKHQINTLFNLTKKPFDGKTIVCFGDSITEFEYQGKGYTDWLAEITGANVINVGIGGTQIRQRGEPTLTPTNSDQCYADLDIINMVKAATSGDFSYVRAGAQKLAEISEDDNTAIVERLAAINWQNVDYVILFAGTNDWTGNNGNTGAVDSTDINYTCGALNKIIELLNTTYKKVQFYYFTPIIRVFVPDFSESVQYQVGDRCRYGSPYYKFINAHKGAWNASDVEETTNMESRVAAYYSNNLKLNSKTLREFSELLYTVVRNNNVPVCDMYNTLGWNLYNFNNFFDNTDSTHPFKGFEQIAEKISKFILSN